MNEVAIVLGSNIHWAPYYYRYIHILESQNIGYDLLIWNREAIAEQSNARVISFDLKDKSDDKNPVKIWKFYLFTRFVKRKTKKNRYKKIVFLGTHGCAPVFGAFFFSKHFKQKYWLDIRDYTYEWFYPYWWLERKAIFSSYETAISSDGFLSFLPKTDYLNVHNIDSRLALFEQEFVKKPESGGIIRISFIGNVRYYDECVRVISTFANDERFRLQFIGAGSARLKDYCEENEITNTYFHDRFDNARTIEFYSITDIVNNVYGNDHISLTTALSNKLYYSLAFKLPILVSANTYMEQYCEEHGFGIAYEESADFPDKLYKWYQEFQGRDLSIQFRNEFDRVMKQDLEFEKKFIEFITF